MSVTDAPAARRDARAVLLRAIAGAVSHDELEHLTQLARAHPGQTITTGVERMIAARRREIDREQGV